ncbi:Pentatricopeptide repeat-containing protein [Raphanus sativus]|uniref:Pentatricopeptide repeat-containing protein At5g15340, mitochondrial n=1 Tax=Raphanus sativus TaxID=3726 RepID=A0A6J0KG69_RAPSA|nr:pentatricopeptide repeat-containing protein At5g15340, mitochondrial [Raphanus sativus]KAJ4882766.1 Pentatricopeptide repeat-containing protein [Raphanus sativus]
MKCLSNQRVRLFLRHCSQHRSLLRVGKELHAVLTTSGSKKAPRSYLSNSLFQFYAASGDMTNAQKVFDEIPLSEKDNVDWTTLLSSLSRYGFLVDSMKLFVEMRRKRVEIDDVAAVCLFGVCAKLEDLWFGEQGHGFAVKMGLLNSVKVCNALMDMYGKCGFVGEVRRLFEMLEEKSVVSWTVVLDTVVKWEGLENGRKVFDEMPERNAVAWTVMVAGYVGAGFTGEALELLEEMVFKCGHGLNFVTLCSLLSACAQSGNLVIVRWVHVYALKTGEEEMCDHVMVGTALVDMYAKCGNIDSSMKVFRLMRRRNVVTWNALFSGLAMHGKGRVVIDMFPEMVREVKPDDLTFSAVLSACSHSGLVEEGWRCFHSLRLYGLEPKVDHYACMVDLLGRAGRIEEAEMLMREMTVPPNEVVLGSLLGSCSVHGKLEIAERIERELVQMSPGNMEYQIVLSNMYAAEGRSDVVDRLRGSMRNRGIRKTPGMSSIHVNGSVHRFSAGDRSHPRTKEIYLKLNEVIERIRSAGYVPHVSALVSPSEVDLEDKELALCFHSEKLAVCFGLLVTKPRTPLYVFKNLRICQDCHSAMKIVSKIYDREIIIRDRNRFHQFKGGSCSCSDHW